MIRKLITSVITLATVSFLFSFCSSGSNYPAPEDLHIEWEILENSTQPKAFHKAAFTITNKSSQKLKPDWEIFFNTIFLSVKPEVLSGAVSISHLSGDFFSISPAEEFPTLSPGEQYTIEYQSNNFLTKNSHSPEALYIVFGENEEGKLLSNYSKKRITIPAMFNNTEGLDLPIPTGNFLFEQNQHLKLLQQKDFTPIIPTPKSIDLKEKTWESGDEIKLYVESGFDTEAKHLKNWLGNLYSGSVADSNMDDASVLLLKSEKDLGLEGYELEIGEEAITIKASHGQGVFYGIQSLVAMMPLNAFEEKVQEIALSQVSVKDEPRFAYRGLFLDVARNFQSKEAVLKLLDLMAFYKLNVFHFNLANDEGWRIEIPGLPELTEIGSKRGHSKEEKEFLWPYYGSGPDKDNSPQGTGYYTVSDFQEILKYAKERHIEVIPEIGVPAHSRAAIIAMRYRYHQQMDAGNEAKANEYLLEDFEDKSEYLSAQNFRGNTICICQESAFRFYEKVLDEMIKMYHDADVPLHTIHTGGDEVPHGAWTASPVCEKFIRESVEVNAVDDLRDYFYRRISKIFEERNIQVAGWEEIGQVEVEENGKQIARPNPEFADAGFRIYAWNAVAGWGGEDMAYQLANKGYEVVICNSSNLYFDLAYDLHPEEPGHEWSGYVNLKTAWQTVPLNHFISNEMDMYGRKLDLDALLQTKEKLTSEGIKNVKGISGQLWTETVKGQEMMEYYLLPKMMGLAERAWSGDPDWTDISDHEKRRIAKEEDWNKFSNALGQRELPRLDFIFGGFNTRLPKPGTLVKDGLMHANVEHPGLIIRYTRDGTEVTPNSPQYTAPVPIDGKVLLRVFTPSGKGGGMTTCDKWDGS